MRGFFTLRGFMWAHGGAFGAGGGAGGGAGTNSLNLEQGGGIRLEQDGTKNILLES